MATIVINLDFDAWPLIMLTINAPNLKPQALMLLNFVAPIAVTIVVPLVTNCLGMIVDRFEAPLATKMIKLDTSLDADLAAFPDDIGFSPFLITLLYEWRGQQTLSLVELT